MSKNIFCANDELIYWTIEAEDLSGLEEDG